MAEKQAKVIITANATTAKKVVEEMDRLIAQYTQKVQSLVAANKQNTAECKAAEGVLKALSQHQKENVADTKRLAEVVNDLANTKLRDLRRALGAGKSAMSALTGSPGDMRKAEQIRKQMREVADQIRLLEGQYVNIAKDISNVASKSDQWLDKAIKQQKELVASTERSSASYARELATLQKLEAEEARRKGAMSYQNASRVAGTTGANWSINELNQAKKSIEAHRNATNSIAERDADARYIETIDKRLDELKVKTKEATISWKQMKQVLASPDRASGEDIKKTMDAIQQKIQQLPAGSQRVADLRSKYQELEQTLKGTRMSQQALNDILNRSKSGKASIDELKRAYKQLEDELHKISTNSDEFRRKQQDMQRLRTQIDEVTGAVNKQSSAWKTSLRNITTYVGLFAVFNKVKEVVTGAIKKNFDYSASLTDIRKVSGLAEKDVEALSVQLSKIDTRTSVEGLAQLAYQGSKLGIGKYGVEGLTQFVKAADQINVAIGEELGEDALPALSKLVETMGLIPKLGIEKAMLATGSAMFKLSTTSTATSNNIVEFSKRLTGVSRTAGITTDQLLALASASDSLFLMPEVSATAMSKFIVALQKNHNLIEKDLGIQEGTIKNMYAAGRAMDAIVLVMEKMRDKGNMNALGSIFKDLGSDGQRLVTAMVTMSKNVDVLKDHLYESQQAFEEATAVTKEYEMQQESAVGILERANNLWEKAFVDPDGVNTVKELAQAWYDISNMMTTSPILNGTLEWSLRRVVDAAKLFVVLLPAIINFAIGRGIWGAVTFFWDMGKAIWSAVTAQTALNVAMKANVFSAVASVIFTAVGAMYGYISSAREAAKAEEEAERKANAWKSKLEEARVETDSLTKKLGAYKVALDNVNLSQADRNTQIARFNKDFRQYINKLGIEIKSVDDLRKHYTALSEEIQRATYYRMREQAKEDALPQFQKDRLAAANSLQSVLKDPRNLGKYDAWNIDLINKYLNQGASGDAIYRYIIKSVTSNPDSIQFGKDGRYSMVGANGKRLGGLGNIPLLSALRWYASSSKRETNKIKEIDDYFGVFVPDDYHPWIDEEPGTLENDAPDKGAEKEARAAAAAQRKEWRQQLKDAQSDATAIIDKVKNYYERQILEVTNKANELNLDEAQTEALIRPVRAKMNVALAVARKAISNVEQGWDIFKQTMRDDMIEVMGENGLNESEMLLEQIEKADLQALQEKIAQLSKSLNRPESALMDQIWRNATKNALANADAERKQREEINRILLEHDFTGTVNNDTIQQMEKIGAFALDANQVKILLGGDEAESQKLLDERASEIATLLKNARDHIVELYQTDVTTEEGRDSFLDILFGGIGRDGSQLQAVLGLYGDDIKAFYLELLKYSDEYTQAEKKQADERKKVYDFMWKRDSTQKAYTDKITEFGENKKESSRQYSFGSKADTILPWGQTEASDPELALLQLKYDLAQEYYKYIEAHGATDEQLLDAANQTKEAYSAILDTVVAKAKATAEAQMKWYKPIEQYGTALGEAVVDEAKSVKDATRSMIESFIDLTGEYVNQKMTQWIMTKLYNAFIAESEQELATNKQAIAAQNATTAVTEAGVEVAAGTASASAKTLGQLGWWGIPLIAVIGGVLGGLMALAKGMLSKAFGGSTPDTKGPNTKLVSGMLTYDSGNVSDLQPFLADNGQVYWAAEDNRRHRGVSLLTTPTATTINGKPSLVAENGPELVIGRETTAAMMMNNPALLKAIYAYDRHHSGRTAYDRGNLTEFGASTANGVPTPTSAAIVQRDPEMLALMAALLARLNEPINAKIDMYGRGNLYDSMSKANEFMRNK